MADVIIEPTTTQVTVTFNDVGIKSQTVISLDIIPSDISSSDIYVWTPIHAIIKPYTTRLRLVVNYLQEPIGVICSPTVINMNFILDEFLDNNVTVFAKSIILQTTTPSFALWSLDKKPRVIRMGDVNIEPSLYITCNKTKVLSSTKIYIDGRSTLFTTPTSKFTSSETITTDTDFWLSKDIVSELYKLLHVEFNIYLSNGEILLGKFDITNNPFQATKTYKGGVAFYLTLKVLV